MKNLILLTSSFPYEGGEQFLETEIKYWINTGFDNLYIIPTKYEGEIREYPDNIKVIEGKPGSSKAYYAFLSLTSALFYKEILYIIRNSSKKSILKNVKSAFKTTALTLRAKDNLHFSLKSITSGENTIYSYWNSFDFYAAILLKKEGFFKKVVSRAHRGDLYEEIANGYMPLKRQFINNFDKVYLLSENALKYYSKTYNTNPSLLDVARLGVRVPLNKPKTIKQKNNINILSLSYCVPIKQIDNIIKSVFKYAQINTHLNVKWTHIGGGPLYNELKKKSDELVSIQENLEIDFIGNLKNSQVIKKLEENYFDVFINTSKSEGIPVSIMEAMSYEIPAIAPDVGEISDLVNESNGYLLCSDFSIDDIITGIDKLLNDNRAGFYRKNAKKWITDNFNSNLNYPAFISKVEKIAGINDSK